jgi:hypothetical protein
MVFSTLGKTAFRRTVVEAGAEVAETAAKRQLAKTGAAAAAEKDLLEAAGRRANALLPDETSPMVALAKLQRAPDPEKLAGRFVNERHKTIVELVESAKRRVAELPEATSAEARRLNQQIRDLQPELRVFRAQQQAELVDEALSKDALAKLGSESAQRKVLQQGGKVYNEYAESLIATGHVDDAIAQLRRAANAYGNAARVDLTGTGRAWIADLNPALRAAARSGDSKLALRILGIEPRVSHALSLLHRAGAEAQYQTRENMKTVARALIDDMRSRPFTVQNAGRAQTIAARPPLTDSQWATIQRHLEERSLRSDLERFIYRME